MTQAQTKSKNIARGSATRTANMLKRRDHILECASNIIAKRGFEAFTLSELAAEAQVTVPTIHNLLGKKSQIVERLVEETVTRTQAVLSEPTSTDPTLAIEGFIDKLMELFSSNEDLYKAAFVAGEREKLFEHKMAEGIFHRSLELAKKVCRDAKENRYLRGEIDTDKLAHQLFGCQRLARQDWMQGYIDLDTYRTQVLIGMFITLAADAKPSFKKQLLDKIANLQAIGG
ncbi:MAG: helix-turn-helix domain-containing protein [Pseudomonadota bacterium]